ncbi:MAG: ribbon-helix-helix domain-containing protein [Dehalococcoidia bacterium]|nr:ribbon-helix-helix domain-containing protein [Dehalococcoidia bacterium]
MGRQITLTDEQYERLRDESRETGLDVAELVRRAVERAYGTHTPDDQMRALHGSFAAWADRNFDGASYVEAIRPAWALVLPVE